MLNLSRGDPDGHKLLTGNIEDGLPTDGLATLQTRRSMQARRSIEVHRASSGSAAFGFQGDTEGLMHSYDMNNEGFGLTDLTGDSDEGVISPHRASNGTPRSHHHRNLKGHDR